MTWNNSRFQIFEKFKGYGVGQVSKQNRGRLRGFHRLGESGQATVEYMLIMTAAVTVAITLGRSLLKVFDSGLLKLGAQVEKDLKTGRGELDIWKN